MAQLDAQGSPTEAESSRRLRVIYSALSGLLSEQEIGRALELWVGQFGGSSSFVVAEYASVLREIFDLGPRYLEARKSLHRTMFDNLEKLPQVPHHLLPSPAQAAARQPMTAQRAPQPPTGGLSDQMVVFNSLLGGIFQRVNRQDPGGLENLRRHLLRELRTSSEIRLPSVQQMSVLLQNADSMVAPSLTHRFNEDEMAEILHWTYLWCCDFVGPVAADRMISQAVSNTEALPQASRFSPRSVL